MSWIDQIRGDIEHAERLQGDFAYYCETLLHIRPKTGQLIPFKLNHSQQILVEKIEEQLRSTGMVRVAVLKPRQTGITTLFIAYLLKRTMESHGYRTGLIAHNKKSSGNMATMMRRFYDNLPAEMRPSLSTDNASELVFGQIDSGYSIAIAGEDGAGRGETLNALHCSEVGFWPNLEEQMSALLQTVPRVPGSIVVFESTANGFGDSWHQFWLKSVAGENGFLPIFIPWFDEIDYRVTPPDDFTIRPDERIIKDAFNIDDAQIFWRRLKLAELNGDERRFRREYPASADEAFQAADRDTFIRPEVVLRARQEELEGFGPLLIGYDPAATGSDTTGIVWRRGSKVEKIERHRIDTEQGVGLIKKIIREDKPDFLYLDVGTFGLAMYQRLRNDGLGSTVIAVNFGSKPDEPPELDEQGRPIGGGPRNKRAECYLRLKRALEGRFHLPDRDDLANELTCFGYYEDAGGFLVLEAKKDIKKRGLPSPDLADALALTFAGGDDMQLAAARKVSESFNRKIEYAGYGYV